ncbi:MAG TPA: tetratricopeptide repeat protein [Ktedonobacterales bacterium]|nr:tetratricopeptide repeat protein [Ktedonobacterales bacterium]
MPVDREIIGERVRQARITANLTQQELAGGTYSKSYISAVERGKMTPSFQALRLLAERLKRPISFFLGEGVVDPETLAQSSAAAYALPDEERQQCEKEARQMLIEAETWLRKDQADKALAVLQVETNAPPTALPLAERPRWYWLAGWAGVWGHRQADAIGWLERGLQVVEAARAQALSAQRARLAEMAERIRETLGGCYYDLGQPARALDYHLHCLAAITDGTVADPELKLMIYKSLGNDHMALGHHDEAILFYKRACDLAKDMDDPRQQGLAYWGLGLAYKASDDLPRAETTFREALMIFERLDNMQLALPLHAVLAQVLTKLKDYQKAARHLRLALETAERLGDNPARQVTLGNIAILRLEQNQPAAAIEAAQEGLNIVVENKDHRTEGQLMQTLAEAYEAAQDFPAAEQAYQNALAVLEQSEDDVLIGRVREHYGQFLAARGRFQEAYEQIGKAQAFAAHQKPVQ